MSKSKKKKRLPEQRPAARRWPLIAVTILAAIGIVAVMVPLRGAEPEGFETLIGRWLRLDGGYILEIRGVDPSGKIEALYLNPRPINVAKAEATRDGSKLNVVVELRAPNYPGSTYTLEYDQEQDQLRGIYFQAALGQSFDVYFVRMK